MDLIFQLYERFPTTSSLFTLISLVLYVAHISSCILLFLSIYDPDNRNTWIYHAQIQEANWEVKYLYAVYFTFATMSTIGYGDIAPITNLEKIYGTIASVIACGVFAYAVNMIGAIFSEKVQKEQEYKEKRKLALKFMRTRNITKQSQLKVLKYLEYQFNLKDREGNMQKGQQVLENISKNIKEEVYSEFYPNILKSSNIFCQYFNTQFIQALSLYMKEVTFSEGEAVYQEGSFDSNIYYVIKGNLQILNFLKNGNAIIRGYIKPGEFFGYQNFFVGGKMRLQTIRSCKSSQVLMIAREDLLKILDQYPREFENYKLVQEMLIQKESDYGQCQFCSTFSHNSQFCPVTHYIADKDKIRGQINQSYKYIAQRKRYYRCNLGRREYQFHSLAGKNLYRERGIFVRKKIVQESQVYNNIYDIYDGIDVEDDEQFLCLTPNIIFQNGVDQNYEVFNYQGKKSIYEVQGMLDYLEQVEEYAIEMELEKKNIELENQKIQLQEQLNHGDFISNYINGQENEGQQQYNSQRSIEQIPSTIYQKDKLLEQQVEQKQSLIKLEKRSPIQQESSQQYEDSLYEPQQSSFLEKDEKKRQSLRLINREKSVNFILKKRVQRTCVQPTNTYLPQQQQQQMYRQKSKKYSQYSLNSPPLPPSQFSKQQSLRSPSWFDRQSTIKTNNSIVEYQQKSLQNQISIDNLQSHMNQIQQQQNNLKFKVRREKQFFGEINQQNKTYQWDSKYQIFQNQNQANYLQMGFSIIPEMDTLKEYIFYKPWNNISEVIVSMKKSIVIRNNKKILLKKNELKGQKLNQQTIIQEADKDSLINQND